MKTDTELDRVAVEFAAIDNAYSMLRYLGYSPKNDSWKAYCRALGSKLSDELHTSEFWQKNPNYKFG